MIRFLLLFLLLNAFFALAQDTTVYTVRFPSDKSRLIKTQIKSLDSLLKQLDEALNTYDYDIQGHTDNVGDRDYNFELSEKRCESIKEFLIKKGVNENRISFEKFSYDVPIADNTKEDGKASNRRATLTIVRKPERFDWRLTPQGLLYNQSSAVVFITQNGCEIGIPADAFQSSDLKPITGEVELEVTEYNQAADFIASGIPMSYEAAGKLFMYHSREMLNIKAFQNTVELRLKDSVRISLHCKSMDTLYNTGFYKFNLKEQKWFEDEKRERIKAKVIEKADKEMPVEEKAETKPEKQTTPKAKNSKQNKESAEEVSTDAKHDNRTETEDTENKPGQEPEVVKTTGTSTISNAPPILQEQGQVVKKKNAKPAVLKKHKKKKLRKRWLPFLYKIKIDTGGHRARLDGQDTVIKRKRLVIDTLACGKGCDLDCRKQPYYIEMGLNLTKQHLDISFDTSDVKYFDQRYQDFSYAGLLKLNPTETPYNPRPYSIRLLTKKSFLQKKARIKIKFDKAKNPELMLLKNITWTFKFKNNDERFESLRKKKFSDMRIYYDSISQSAMLELKEKDKFTNIHVKAKKRKMHTEQKLQDYNQELTKRKRMFDFKEHNRAIQTVNTAYSRYYCFWLFNDKCFATEERGYSYRQWIHYFNTHKPQMKQRFDSLQNHLNLVIRKCVCPEKPKEIFRPRGDGPLLLLDLGIYNFDDVIGLNDTVCFASPRFVNKKGKQIKIKQAFLLLGGINGAMHLAPDQTLTLIKKYKNTLFIVDTHNRRYKLVLQSGTNLSANGNLFNMLDITDNTKTLEGLQKELMGD